MKNTIIILIFQFIFFSLSSQEYKTLYITGENVNIRNKPDFNSAVSYQANWGDKFLVEKQIGNWYQALNDDESAVVYVYSDYLKNKKEFTEKALEKENRNPKTELFLIDFYLEQGNYKAAINIAVELINNRSSKIVMARFEDCELVGHAAYQLVTNERLDDDVRANNQSQLEGAIEDRTILNLIEMDKITALIKNGKHNEANKHLDHILIIYSNYLFLEDGCDYDLYGKAYPQWRLKNLYFINYHLLPTSEKYAMFRNLKKIRDDVSLYEKTRKIAADICSKLNSIWSTD